MDELSIARQEINETDKQMAELFVKRMRAVQKVAKYKSEHGLPIFDGQREDALIQKNSTYVGDVDLRSYYITFLKNTMEVSKQYQHRLLDGMRVAYSGVEGAFAHIASKKIFPDGCHISYGDFASAYKSVEDGKSDCCVLPIENSYAGEVGQVTDLLFSGSLYINGVYDLEIVHNLLVLPGTKMEDIKTVISHPQALSQCDGYIREHNFGEIKAKNTAMAAQMVSESLDKSVAAIASVDTAELYGLDILDHDINESSGNTTRFAVFSQTQNRRKTSGEGTFILMFTVGNVAGALAGAINIIGKYGFNMKVLRSRPVKEVSWEHYFYVEAEGDVYGEEGNAMLKELSENCAQLKVAGSFKNERKLD